MVRRLARRQGNAPPKGLHLAPRRRQAQRHDENPGQQGKNHATGTVADLCAAWAETRKGSGRHRRPIADLSAIAGQLKPRQLHEGHTQALIARWKQIHSPATVFTNRHGLVALLKFIGRAANIPDLHMIVPRVRNPGPRTQILAAGELPRLLTAASPWMRLTLTLATSMGWRLAECLRAAPEGYHAEAHTLTVLVKGGKLHTLPTTPQVETLLDTTPPTDNPATPFVETLRGRPYSTHAAHHEWTKLKKTTGVNPNLIIHDLRRSAAVALYELSRDLRAVEQMLGHENLSTTGRYLEHRDPAKLRSLLSEMWTPKGPQGPVQ